MKSTKVQTLAQVMQIAYSNTEHLVGSYGMEKQVCVQLAGKLLGVNTLAPLPIANLLAQLLILISILEKHHPSITLLGQ